MPPISNVFSSGEEALPEQPVNELASIAPASKRPKNFLTDRFPYLYNECLKRGYEMDKDLLPIAPAHHYCMGGIKVDLY